MNAFLTGLSGFIKRNIISLVIFALVLTALFSMLPDAQEKGAQEDKRILKESIERAAIMCYALEGRYPESLDYIKNNYGVLIDEERYFVVYEVLGSNLLFEVTVFER